jgi:hypothetical protein
MLTKLWAASATLDTEDPLVRCRNAPQALMLSVALAMRQDETALDVVSVTTPLALAIVSQDIMARHAIK